MTLFTTCFFAAAFAICTIPIATAVAPPEIETSVERLSSCEEQCNPFCAEAGLPTEQCTPLKSRHCGFFRRRCTCKCARRRDLGGCMEIIVTGAQGGTYGVTSLKHNGRHTYQRSTTGSPRYIYWTGSTWNVGNSPTSGSMKTCSEYNIGDCSAFQCKTLYRKDGRCGGSFKSKDYFGQVAICNPDSDKPCCGPDNRCGGDAKHCQCDVTPRLQKNTCMDYGSVTGRCLYEQVLNAETPNHCAITPVDMVDNEVSTQQLWNVATLVGGVVGNANPVFGFGLDAFFAVIDPHSPVTTPFALANYVIDGFNKKIEALQKCLDARIVATERRIVQTTLNPFITKAASCAQMKDTDRPGCISDVYEDLRANMVEVFRVHSSTTHLTYKNMLPAFNALYPLFFSVITENLQHHAAVGDCHDMCSIIQQAKSDMEALRKWALAALNSIVDFETPRHTDFNALTCTQKLGGFRSTQDDYVLGNEKTLQGLKQKHAFVNSNENRYAQTMQVKMSMTKRDDLQCTFTIAGPWMSGQNDKVKDLACSAMRSQATLFATSSKTRFDREFRPAFRAKYITTIEKYIDSLGDVKYPSCKIPKPNNCPA